ncbi:Transcriptional regulator, IclR family [Candidatus Burkholderia verschuerenii]|uniref:Transcriptional regulator, IclR family n=1 Tax=Candidatus Burkholderia verschuerenii TaxID=242163 RepID=A0A0L0MET3_9BURK|nr:IclR family transcriptional regulator [Candidatus Burkholderia verschuerenii]KND60479.1 Transcriptional regulator, IclR family [Candidatus Burkholderia verschuerenii]
MDKTLLKGLMLLEALADQNGKPVTIPVLAEQVGLTKSNTHRTLQTLAHAGYATRDEVTGNYRSTFKLFELGAKQMAQIDVRQFASSHMRALVEFTQETVHLSILDGGSVVYVDKIESAQPVRAYSVLGRHAPAYCVATGKILLAHQSQEYQTRHLTDLSAYTKATITDLPTLKAELARASANGYAVNRGEWREAVGGVAAPIFDAFSAPVAAIGISGPLERLSAKRMKELAPSVQDAALKISRAMGYRK